MSRAEASVFMKFANTIEDPAIEYFAPNVFGGKMLEALRFSIKHIYIMSPGIENSSNAFIQLINALVNFGDMGIVKGDFTFPEARTYFKKVAPLYNEAIVCPDSRRRLDIAKECMEITRPLWEEAVKEREFFDKLIEELLEELEKNGLHTMEDSENSMRAPADSSVSKRREKMVKNIEKAMKATVPMKILNVTVQTAMQKIILMKQTLLMTAMQITQIIARQTLTTIYPVKTAVAVKIPIPMIMSMMVLKLLPKAQQMRLQTRLMR